MIASSLPARIPIACLRKKVIDQIVANGIVTGCSYALVAFGFALIYNTTRIFHFAHGAVYTFSIYVLYSLQTKLAVPTWVAILFSLALTALLGVGIDEVVYQPLVRKKSSLLLLLSSLATYMTIVNLLIMVYGNEIKVLNPEIQSTYVFGNVLLSRLQVNTILFAVAILTSASLALRLTKAGRMIRALRDDVDLLSALGVNPRFLRWLVFALGSALAGVAAVLQGLDVGANPNSGLLMFVSGAVAVIIAGGRAFEAAIVGAFVIGVLHAFAVWEFAGRWEESVTFLLLILFLLLRPEGIFARTRRVEESA